MLIATMAGVTALVVLIAVWRVLVPGPSTKLAFAVASTAGPAGSAGPLTGLLPPRSAGVGSSADGSARPRVSVVVPALNEEESIDWVVENIPDWVSEVVLVDGLSIDGTELVVRDRCSDLVIVHQRSRGKGAALRAGFAAASGEIIVMIDADGSTDPREMGRFVDALIDGADFVKGSRNLAGGGSTDFTLLRHLGNLGFVWAANLLFGVRFTDLCYGYCAFWRRDVDRLALTADGFEIEMELILSAIKAGLTIAEVPSMELERRAGDSNLNAWKDGKRVLKTLLRQRVRRLDAARAQQVQVWLSPVMRAAHSTAHWVPAGADRRRPLDSDRRRPTLSEAGVSARDERRLAQRRTAPDAVSEVLVARIAGPADASDGAAASQPVGLVSRSA
jgi:hypothetical protein